mgnify:CR=1 FL=1
MPMVWMETDGSDQGTKEDREGACREWTGREGACLPKGLGLRLAVRQHVVDRVEVRFEQVIEDLTSQAPPRKGLEDHHGQRRG